MSSNKENNNNNNNSMHIVMYPWFALSHLTSFLRLANKLADHGLTISYFVPTKTQLKLSQHNHRPHLITFIPINVPHVDGLPVGAETTNDVPLSMGPLIMTAMDMTRNFIDTHLGQLKPDIIFFDFVHWMPDLARKYGAKSIYYATSSLVRYAYCSREAQNAALKDGLLTEADFLEAPPGFPSPTMRMHVGEARSLVAAGSMVFGGGMTLMKRIGISLRECDAVGSKTCREMEGPFVDYYEKQLGKPVLLAGPLVPEPPAGKLDERFDGWLKGFGEGSVVYCALGSECVLDKKLFQELVLGLELTGKSFLAALKLPTECKTLESAVPEGFLERTKGRGIIHNGWVQQPLLLRHPSIGCFVTHCGAGSLSEAILSECQLVLLPQAVDQFINARMMSMELRVGVEVEKREDDCFFSKENVHKAISTAMEVESEVGKEIRVNHAKWRKVLLKEGLEESYICEFIRDLQDLLK